MTSEDNTFREENEIALEEKSLPDGWFWVRLGEVSTARLGKTPRRAEYRDAGSHRIVKFRDVTVDGIDYSTQKAGYVVDTPGVVKALRPLHRGDVLITASAHSGDQIGKKCAYVDQLPIVHGGVYFVGELLGVTTNPQVMESKWAYFWFESEDGIRAVQSAVAGVHLTAGRAQNIAIPLAPLVVQKRIIGKIEELLPRVKALRERLMRLKEIMKRFRQSVLSAACSGRLTEDWRDIYSSNNEGEELLKSILSIRPARLRDNISRDSHQPRRPDGDQVREVPNGWALASLDQLSCLVTSGSRGWAKHYSNGGPLFIRAQNINKDVLCLDDVAHVSPPLSAEGRRTCVRLGDILITITGANVTKSALVKGDIGEAYVSQHVSLVRPVDTMTGPFMYLWIISPVHGRAKLTDDAYGAGKPGLNLENIKEMTIALPGPAEQKEIVSSVEELFDLADMIEKRVETELSRTDKMTKAILAKAFRGELVSTVADLDRRKGEI